MLRRVFEGVVPRNVGSATWISTFSAVRAAMSETEYHRVADHSLDLLVDDLEGYFEQIPSADVDIQYSQGVVTVQMGRKGTYVINKQAPNKQIWLSSPISGPFRYDYENGEWIYHRDRHNILFFTNTLKTAPL